MSEPNSIFTFPDLVTKVAREAGIAYYGPSGDQKALPPIDIHDLELCKEIVNDAIKMFIADAPDVGWRWTKRIASVVFAGTRTTGTVDSIPSSNQLTDATLEATYDTDDDLIGYYCYILTGTGVGSWAKITGYTASGGTIVVADWLDQYGQTGGTDPVADDTFAITDVEVIAGDTARYPLPEGFCGEVSGDIHYAKDSSHSAHIEWRHESLIRQHRAVNVVTGDPFYAAIRPWEPQTGTLGSHAKRRWELIVDPQPSATDTVEFPYEIIFDKLDMECGVGDSGGDTTILDATRTEGNDYFKDWVIEIVAGTGKGSYAVVTGYTGSSGTFAVGDWLTAAGAGGGTNPGANSIYVVQPVNNLHPAGAKFDEAIKAASLAEAEMRIDEVSGNWMQKYIQKAVPKAYQADARTSPRKLGSSNKYVRGVRGHRAQGRIYNDVTYD